MAYFLIDGYDFSMYVNALSISTSTNYNSQTNAAGDTLIDYINTKRSIDVGIIPLEDEAMKQLLAAIEAFEVSITYRNPISGELEDVDCIIPDNQIEYYTIRADKVMYNAFKLKFTEL